MDRYLLNEDGYYEENEEPKKQFHVGQLVAYCPTNEIHEEIYHFETYDDDGWSNLDDYTEYRKCGDEIYKVEIGVIKRIDEENGKAFVWYHSGSTAACTSLENLYPIENDYYFKNNEINSLDKED